MLSKTSQDSERALDIELALFQFDESEEWLDKLRCAEKHGELGQLGPYQLISEVARGGQGIVYRAFDPMTKRIVALKVLRSGRLSPASVISRFHRELEAISRLEHPSIIVLYGARIIDNEMVLIMRWVDGMPLVEWAQQSDRTLRDVVQTCSAVCEAVQHAHQRGVIHRDLKPTNILVDADGHPYVLDFGLAKFEMQDQSHLTQDGQFLGTPEFAAPEQISCGAAAADVRSDVFALGSIFARAWNKNETMYRDLEAIVSVATRPEPHDRYASVDAMLSDLTAWLEGRPVAARKATAIERLAHTIRRRPITSFSIGSTAVALIALTIFLAVQTTKYRAEAKRAGALQHLFADALTPYDGALSIASMTVAEVLDRCATRLDAAEGIPALTRSELHLALAEKFAASHMWKRADAQAQRAIEYGEPLGRNAWSVLSAAYRIRGVLAVRQSRADAFVFSGRSKSFIEKYHGRESAEYANAVARHACAGWRTGGMQSHEVEKLVSDSLLISESLPGGNPIGVALALRIWSEFLAEHNRMEEADEALARAQSLLTDIPTTEGRDWTLNTAHRAVHLTKMGQFHKAKRVLSEAIMLAKQRGDALGQSKLTWALGELFVSSDTLGQIGLPVLSEAIDRRLEVIATDLVGASDTQRWGALYQAGSDKLFNPLLDSLTYARALSQAGKTHQVSGHIDQLLAAYPAHDGAPFWREALLIKARTLFRLGRGQEAVAVLHSIEGNIGNLPTGHPARQSFAELEVAISRSDSDDLVPTAVAPETAHN